MKLNNIFTKPVSIAFLIGSLFGVSPAAIATNDDNAASVQHPKTCQEAIELVLSNIDADSKKLLLSIKKEELRGRRFITGWGKGIRDGFGLNEGNFELMESCQALRDDAAFHPVNISGIIMEEVWSALQQSK